MNLNGYLLIDHIKWPPRSERFGHSPCANPRPVNRVDLKVIVLRLFLTFSYAYFAEIANSLEDAVLFCRYFYNGRRYCQVNVTKGDMLC